MKDTTRGPILGAIASLALPATLSFILQNLYHQNDAFFLGRVGATASNALGLFMMVMIANFGFVLIIARGTQSLVGRRFGAGQHEGAGRAIAQGMSIAMRVALPLAVVEWIFAPEILRALGGDEATVGSATTYLRTLFLFMPAMFAQPVFNFSFQAMGDATTPFRLEVLAVVTNTALNWMLVLPHGEFGGLGVQGAAIATGTSRLLSALLAFRVLVRRERVRLLLQAASYRLDRKMCGEILRVGVPAGASTLLYSLVGMGLLAIIGRFGQEAYGAYGIGFRGVESISFMIVLGVSAATGTVVSHAVGAGDFERARRAGHVGVLLSVALMAVTSAVFLTIPESLASIFSEDAHIIAAAATYIWAMGLCQVFQALEMTYGEAMAGAGSSLRTASITIPGNLLRLPLAWLMAVTLGLGLAGVWYAIIISAFLKGVAVALLYVSGRWEKAMLRGREALGLG